MRLIKNFTALTLLFSIYLGTFAPLANAQKQARVPRPRPVQNMIPNNTNGLDFRLSEGTPEAEQREIQRQAKAAQLTEGETESLLKRLPPVKAEQNDQQDFAKRLGTLPPPKTGNLIPVKFPSDAERGTPKINNNQNLEVLRFSPTGDVPLAADLSITFSQPMVAVTSQEQAAVITPVRLSPAVKGRWRWLGTKTLIFDTDQRFPMATKFTATVPAGTKSATGNVLQKDASWTFSTPPPKVLQTYPSGVTNRDVLMFASFDQEINQSAVLSKINAMGGGKKLQLRLATPEEIAADASINYYVKQAMPNRWLAFRAVNSDNSTQNALPPAAPINVTFPAGTPSAEGPLTTAKAQSFSFNTFGAMKFVKGYCNYDSNKICAPSDAWYLQFTNPIDPSKFDKEMVKIEPAIEGVQIVPSGNFLYITGYKPGRRTYKVTVSDSSLKDTFGQTLTGGATATFNVGSAPASLTSQGGNFVVLDPTAKPNYSVYSINQPSLKVQIRAVSPADWEAFRLFMRNLYYDEQKRPPLPGRVVVDKVIQVENKPDEMVETRLDLSPALDGGFGHAIVFIEPTIKQDKYDRTKIVAWTESTQIGLDAFVDNQELVGFATDLKTGKPLDGVEMHIAPNDGKTLSQQLTVNSQQSGGERTWTEWITSFVQPSGPSPETSEKPPADIVTAPESVESAQAANHTQTNGLLRLGLPDAQPNKQSILIAKRGKDVAFLPENTDYYYSDYGSWYKKSDSESLRWFVFNDRGMYRPKEEVAIKGYVRKVTAGKFADIAELGDTRRAWNYSVKDSQGNEVAKGAVNLNSYGAFDFKFKLPDNMNLGNANIEFKPGENSSSDFNHSFQVQEFRRPEFEVTAKNETAAPYFVGESANVSVEAKYYAGGALANAETNWTVTATPTNYTPPNRSDFTFGKWFPWWRSYGEDYGNTTTQAFKGVTGADGKHLLKIDFVAANPTRPYSVKAEANVQDVNRQTFAASTNLLVHPAELYVGIRTPRTFVNKGEPFKVESITTDIDGKAVANRDVTVKAVLKDWQYDKNSWQLVTVDEQTCSVKSTADVSVCNFTAKAGGVYTITASVSDDRERKNESELTLWVSGGKTVPKRNVEQEEAQLIPDKKEYAPTDTAEILVQTPFVPAEGVLTLRRNGLVETERFTMNEPSKVLKVKLDERYLPNINVQVDLTGAAARVDDKGETAKDAPKRPAFATGALNLPLSLASRKLTVTAEPAAKNIEPGGETNVAVTVKDNNGNPVANSEIAVVVVDESVLALSGYDISDPLGIFYQQIGAGVTDYHLRKDVLLGNQKDLQNLPINGRNMQLAGALGSGMMDMAAAPASVANARPMQAMRRAKSEVMKDAKEDDEVMKVAPDTPITVRQNFNALAVFAPSVKTDASGKVNVAVKLPDNLTRYRITAISVTEGKKFGKGESNLTARQPLMVRPSAPRFLNFGDKFELPVVVQNQTDNPMTVDVAVRATNAELTAGGGRQVVIPANDRAEIRFPVSAVKAGIARFQIATTSGKFADAAEIQLPVWTPATTEAFATYGTTDQNEAVVQPVQAPTDVFPQFGGLEITTSSTQLQELTDAYIYLSQYPYECSEQISSRMIATAALRDVLQAFKAEGVPTPEALKAQFASDMEKLHGRQRDDGSFGLWGQQRERYEYPYVSVNVAHALARAKQKGYDVPKEMFERSQSYLKNIEKYIPKEYSKESRWAIQAYALYVRNLMGDKDAPKARALIQTAGGVEKLSLESLGWLLNVLNGDKNSDVQIDQIRKLFNNRAVETAGAAAFTESYTDGMEVLLHTNRRTDGIILESLLGNQPENDLIPKIVRGLLANKTKGRWANTQENVFILLALDKYFNVFEKVTPDFVAQVWLGQAYAGEQSFKGREIDFKQVDVPMKYLLEQSGASNLILNKQGAGRLYYRIGMKYAPKNLKLAPADYGFEVTRKYEGIDSPDDARLNPDGSWTIKSGARVRVRLSLVAPARRYHVALVDPLPAGLEILNPELAVTGTVPEDNVDNSVLEYGAPSYGRGYYYWRYQWFDHQNFRDERAEAFTSLLWEGVYNYSYVARATTPGQFVVPPAKAEEMYMPETFGRSGTDFVRVE